MQLVTLSTRPDVLAETWAHQRHFMPWLERLLVVAPASLAARFTLDGQVSVISDEDLTGRTTAELAAMDHMTRNFTIRGALGDHATVDDEFVMADDDARPLKAVTADFFRCDGRDRCFYFYDLDAWAGDGTPFDTGQHNVRELLAYLGHERLGYGSHMPQLIRKAHLAEAWALARRLTDHAAICEWAWYFNVARALHPDDFSEPEPFRTLCWPQYPGEWAWWVRPPEYVFENFYPDLYRPGHLFEGLPTALDPAAVERHSVEKVLRWSEFGRRVERLDFPPDVANPWTGTSTSRRIAFGVLRRAQQAFGYVSFSQQRRITELQGTVARLDDELRRLQKD